MSEQRVYIGLVRKNPDTDYWIDFPDFPGCVVGASNVGDLLARAPVVLEDHIKALAEQGVRIAPPSTLHAVVTAEQNAYIMTQPVPAAIPEHALKNPVHLLHLKRAPKPSL